MPGGKQTSTIATCKDRKQIKHHEQTENGSKTVAAHSDMSRLKTLELVQMSLGHDCVVHGKQKCTQPWCTYSGENACRDKCFRKDAGMRVEMHKQTKTMHIWKYSRKS